MGPIVNTGGDLWRSFSDIDASGDAKQTIGYLDGLASVGAIVAGKRRARELLELVDGMRALDVGSGSGFDALAMADLVAPRGTVVGVDPSQRAVETARARAERTGSSASFVCGDALALPFEDDAFDACVCDRTLQHLTDPEGALREMVRVLRPGGTLVISEVTMALRATEAAREVTAVVRGLLGSDEDGGWIAFMAPLLLNRAGFASVDVEDVRGAITDRDEVVAACGLDRDATGSGGAVSPDAVAAARRAVHAISGEDLWLDVTTTLFRGRAPKIVPSG